MPNRRCKVHGGKSTGPRTPEGLERSRRANWKHGYYSREAKAERSRVRAAILAVRNLRDYSVCGAIAVVDASDVSNFAQTPDGQRRNPNINRYAIAKRSVFISTC